MRGVDDKIEALVGEDARKALRPAEASLAQRAGQSRLGGPAGERHGHVVTRVAVERPSQLGGLSAAPKNEKFHRFHGADEVAL